MKIQSKATRVLERTSHYLKSGLLKDKPVWYDVVSNNPPQLDLTKKPKTIQHKLYEDPISTPHKLALFKTRLSDSERKRPNRLIHRVPKLEFFEDELRDLFYKQHPWEFSRPKTLVENDGTDNSRCDWSHMLQLHKPLDGESVVQRTMWILKNEKKDLFSAYDKARFEFYRLRMEEEMSSLVSREESSMYGLVIPTTNLEFGVQQEQEYVDVWAKVASDKTKVKNASASSRALGASIDTETPEVSKLSIFEAEIDLELEEEPAEKKD